jgi:hypothetical protein
MLGYDSFIADPGTVEKTYCQVCQTECEAQRNVYSPTGWASAMSKHYSLHDYFICPHANEEWHQQALELVGQIEKTPSKRIAQLMRQDLEDLLKGHNIRLK